MANSFRMLAILWLISLVTLPMTASATDYTLWINGRNGGGKVGDYTSFTYWGPKDTAAGVNKKAVNWDGYNSISSQNSKIRDALDCFCTGGNWCYIATHSAGNLMLGYTLATYGGTSRLKRNAKPNTAGQCGSLNGTSQTGWNIKWVRVASGAAGGSELADILAWATSEPLSKDLKTTTARAMYNHNNTRDLMFYMYAGAKGNRYSGQLMGQDDGAVAYHSTGGVSGTAAAAYCNPGILSCNDLTLGSAVNQGGKAKWSNHYVMFRDNDEIYDHFLNANWKGIVSVVRKDMVNHAK
jgi:hypothetical protein